MGSKLYFEILEIAPTKDEKVIKKAYRKLALKYHPDKNQTEEAHVKFIRISEAYENLLAALDYANKSPEERKEYTKNQSTRAKKPQKTAQEIYEERLREAKRRYEEMKRKEAEENEAYYQTISSGVNWKVFRAIMIGCILFAGLFILDSLILPSRWEKSEITGENRVINYGGISYRRIVPIRLETDEKLWVKPSFSSSATNYKTVYIERTWFFHDIKKVWTWDSGKWFYSVADFTVTGTFPLVPIFLFIPFLTYIIKGRTLTYSLLFNISFYMFGIMLIALLIQNDRWAHLLTLGFM
tara:strand:+ start:46142 stop:47032 length:891 start_codon:yes stop_codon:yes gene_type:complete